MCDSISILSDVAELTERFGIDHVLFYTSNRRDIRPTESISAIVVHKNERRLDEFRWGMLPFWAKDSIWLDSGSFLDKRAFQRIIKKQRCVIPCSEFQIIGANKKRTESVRVTMQSGTFGIAGLYDVWRSASGEELRTCTVLMTEPNPLVAPFLGRMPAILEEAELNRWLDPELKDPRDVQRLLRPMEAGRMSAVRSEHGRWSVRQPELA